MKRVGVRLWLVVLGGAVAVLCLFLLYNKKIMCGERDRTGIFSWSLWGDGAGTGGVARFLKKIGKNRENGDAAGQAAEPEETKLWLILRLECEIPKEFREEIQKRVERERKTGEILGKASEDGGKNGEPAGKGTVWETFHINIEGSRLVLCGRVRLDTAEASGVWSDLSNSAEGVRVEPAGAELAKTPEGREVAEIGKKVAESGKTAEESRTAGLILQMISVCDKLTAIRPVQAMIFPKKTASDGKNAGKAAGSVKKEADAAEKTGLPDGTKAKASGLSGGTENLGLPELTVTEGKNGFRIKVEETAAEAEKALAWLPEGVEIAVKAEKRLGSEPPRLPLSARQTRNMGEDEEKYAKLAGKEERKGVGLAGRTDEKYIYIEVSAKTEVQKPKLTTKQAKQCNTLLASYTTYFETAGSGRARNIAVGAAHLNGIVVYPGEEFSTAAALMPFSEENGYAQGGTFINGEVSESIGGGVCQISSTLYNALLQTELPVTKRYAHSMPVAYVPLGRDAAIAGDYKDLCFKNTTEAPVLLLCETAGKKVTVSLYGTAAAKKEGVRFRQVMTKETAEEVWVETYREFPDADGRLCTEKVAESRYRYPR